MKRITGLLGFAAIAALTLCGGVIHGRLSGRWGPPLAMIAAGEKLAQLPAQFGPWKLAASHEFSEITKTELECTGYVDRTYVNQNTGERVDVMLVVGPTGAISVHTPEVCVGGRDYTIAGERRQVTVETPDAASHRFWSVAFRSRGLEASTLRICYGWTAGGPWMAPENPRFYFVGKQYLYKVQVSAQGPLQAASTQRDAGQQFLRDFIPAAQMCLIDSSSK